MKENEEKLSSTAAQKEKIRQRYRGVNSDELDVIPAIPQTNFTKISVKKELPYMLVFQRTTHDRPLLMNCRRITIKMLSVDTLAGN